MHFLSVKALYPCYLLTLADISNVGKSIFNSRNFLNIYMAIQNPPTSNHVSICVDDKTMSNQRGLDGHTIAHVFQPLLPYPVMCLTDHEEAASATIYYA